MTAGPGSTFPFKAHMIASVFSWLSVPLTLVVYVVFQILIIVFRKFLVFCHGIGKVCPISNLNVPLVSFASFMHETDPINRLNWVLSTCH